MARKAPGPRATTKRAKVDFDILDAETKAGLLLKAKQIVDQDEKNDAEDAYLQQAIAAEQRARRPEEAMEDVLIDVAGHSNKIMVDGVEYFHGYTYRVPYSLARVFQDTMQATWRHEHEVGGANRDEYRKPRNITLSPRNAGASVTSLLN